MIVSDMLFLGAVLFFMAIFLDGEEWQNTQRPKSLFTRWRGGSA